MKKDRMLLIRTYFKLWSRYLRNWKEAWEMIGPDFKALPLWYRVCITSYYMLCCIIYPVTGPITALVLTGIDLYRLITRTDYKYNVCLICHILGSKMTIQQKCDALEAI